MESRPLLPTRHPAGATTIATWAALCAGILPALIALWVLVHNWVPVPYWDEWKTPGEQIVSYYRGTLTLQELCSQHNESRKLFPRLVYLPIAIAARWDVRIIMCVSFALVCTGSVLLYLLARRSCRSRVASACCFAAMNVWLFWPRQYESFVLSNQGELFVPPLALAAACLINLSQLRLGWKAALSATLAHIATYSVANGMLVWLLAFPFASATAAAGAQSLAKNWHSLPRLAYLAAAGASIVWYFHGYEHPPLAPPLVLSLDRLPELVIFAGRWLGDLPLTDAPLLTGILIATVFAGFSAFGILRGRADGRWRQHYPFVVLGIYTLVSGCVAAVGRLAFGPEAATQYRYAPYTAFAYIAVAGLAGSIHAQITRPHLARLWRRGCALAAVAVVALGVAAFEKERRLLAKSTADRRHLLEVVRWSNAIPGNPDLMFVSPYENTLSTIIALNDHGVLYPPLVDEQLAGAVRQPPPVSGGASAGALERVAFGAAGAELIIEGWARTPAGDAPADCVVIGYETPGTPWKLFTVVATGAKRRDVVAQFGNDELLRAGFSRNVQTAALPEGDLTFRGWAVTLATGRAVPLEGAVTLRLPAK